MGDAAPSPHILARFYSETRSGDNLIFVKDLRLVSSFLDSQLWMKRTAEKAPDFTYRDISISLIPTKQQETKGVLCPSNESTKTASLDPPQWI